MLRVRVKKFCTICRTEIIKPRARQVTCSSKDCKRRHNHFWRIFNEYGVTKEQYETVLVLQNYTCKICKKKNEEETLNVDHDHATGEFRGLLCGNCNRAIGLFRDNPALMHSAIAYLMPDLDIIFLKAKSENI